jgi:3-hydroxy-9,10-secoandrosta-1,3,5(10)-triene-9,17-dione monooxygenase
MFDDLFCRDPAVTRVLDAVARCGPQLRANSTVADHERRLPASSLELLTSAGALALTTPTEHGGLGLGTRAVVDVARSIARWCPAAAWETVISTVSVMLATRFPAGARARVFGNGAPVMASIIPPPADPTIRRDGDGYRVSGRWPYASNIYDAEWAIAMLPLPSEDGQPQRAFGLFKAADWAVEDTWFTVGMRGTGSATMVVDDVWLSPEQVCSALALFGPSCEVASSAPGFSRVAAMSTLATTIASPALGAVETALTLTAHDATKRGIATSTYAVRSDSGAHVRDLGQAAATIRGAILQLNDAADIVDGAAHNARSITETERAQIRGNVATAGRAAGDVMNEIMWLQGSSAFAEQTLIQQLWRDVNVAIRHGGVAAPTNFETWGDALVGRDPVVPIL